MIWCNKMTMKSYDKNKLECIAQETGFIRENLEKVIRLSGILTFLNTNSLTKDKLVLKGGTAINLTVFEMPRLSVDIDLDYDNECDRDTMMADRKSISAAVMGYMQANGYSLHPGSKSPHALDSWVFTYINTAGNRDNIKVEINYLMRVHIYEPVKACVNIPYLEVTEILALAPLELFGSKIKALIERSASRDLYDVNNMIESGIISPDDYTLLRKVVLCYLAVGGSRPPMSQYDFSAIERIRFAQIRASLLPVLRKSEKFDFESAKKRVMDFLPVLMRFDDRDLEFIEQFNNGSYRPELLFQDEEEILRRIASHPMALWKINHR